MDSHSLRLVHLSDIHFSRTDDQTPWDLNSDVRHELTRDISRLKDTLTHFDGVVVTGDVAFSGSSSEYGKATTWLKELCDRIGTPEENVWVVPGNHDVDRNVVNSSATIRTFHKAARASEPGDIDRLLADFIMKDATREIYFTPLADYNRFADQYDCGLSPDRPFWEHPLPLNDGSTLLLRGMNSALVSDDQDAPSQLILGEVQTNIHRDDGVVVLTLCHHPPSWMLDHDSVEQALSAKATVQLFGHRHAAGVQIINGCLRVHAGATQPSRTEAPWQPHYNVIDLTVLDANGSRQLEVVLRPRSWDDSERAFVPHRNNTTGEETHQYCLQLGPWDKPPVASDLAGRSDTGSLEPTPKVNERTHEQASADSLSVSPARRLVYLLMSLPPHLQKRILRDLKLFDDDPSLDLRSAIKRALELANGEGRLGEVWDAIIKVRRSDEHNPFSERPEG